MFILFAVAILVIVGLVGFMFFILKGTVKKINSQTKLYFVDKLQEYDYMINQKEEKLNSINQEIHKQSIKKTEEVVKPQKNTYEFDYQIIDLFNKTKYQDKNIFELNKKIDETFNINYIDLLKKFLEHIHDDKTYDFCLNLKDKFTSELVYELKIMNDKEQENKLKEILDDTEYLTELLDLNSPNIMVYVGSKSENYDYLSKYIKTIYSKDIYKGIRIIYRKKIYDYSLNERNV